MGQFYEPVPVPEPVPEPEPDEDEDEDDWDDEDEDEDEVIEHDYMDIIITHTCYCFYEDIGFLPHRPSDHFTIEAPEITRGMVKAFLADNYEPPCNHCFYEFIEPVPDMAKTWSPFYGS